MCFTQRLIKETVSHCNRCNLFHLIEDHPVGVDLRVPLWIQHYGLIGSEVSQGDLSVLRAMVDYVNDVVIVEISFTCISNAVA